jgi:hypothetical protein
MLYERLDFTNLEHGLLRHLYKQSEYTSFQAFLHDLVMQSAHALSSQRRDYGKSPR